MGACERLKGFNLVVANCVELFSPASLKLHQLKKKKKKVIVIKDRHCLDLSSPVSSLRTVI